MKPLRHLLLYLTLLLPGLTVAAEDETGLWLTTTYTKPLDDRLDVGLLAEPRFLNDAGTLQRWMLRGFANYRLGRHFSLGGGYDYHKVKTPRSTWEQRLWQQIAFRSAAAGPSLFGHARIEERFFDDVDEAYRLRLKAGLRHPIWGTPWSAIAADEVFVGLNEVDGGPDDRFDQNRFFLGLGRRLSPGLGLEFGYQNQYIEGGTVDRSNHLLLIKLAFQ